MKKSSMIAVSALALGTAGLIGLSQVASAATKNTSSGLVEAIASKFNLNKDEVQKVVDEHRASVKTQKAGASKAQLEQLVKDAKLTQEQADAITAKREELKKSAPRKESQF